jgi:hypothetical protein
MIDLSRPALHAEGVTIFPDHADSAQFHYLPDAPRLRQRADGTPELSLLKYQLDPALHQALGAGMLALTVDLGVDDAVLRGLTGRLRAQFALDRTPVLSPVVADSGSCELIVIDKDSRASEAAPTAAPSDTAAPALVERILGSGVPSLYGDNAATFMVVLDAEGVALVEQALRAGGLPVGVVYTLQALALRPAMRAQITARWQDAYHYYENRLHGGKLLLATDIGTTIQDLVHSEALTVQVDDFLPPDQKDQTYQQAVDQMQSYVINEFFKPTLGSAPPPAGGSSDGPLAAIGTAIKDVAGFFSITYTLKQIDRTELKTLTYQLQAASAERLTLAPQGTLSILISPKDGGSPVDTTKLITEVAAATSQQMDFDVGAALKLDAEDIDHLEVFLHYADRDADLLLDDTTPRRTTTFWYQPSQGLAVKYYYEVDFKAGSAGFQNSIKSADASTENRVIRLNPRTLYQRVDIRAVAQGIPFDQYPTVIIDLKADDTVNGWSSDQTLQLDAAHLEATWSMRAQPDANVVLRRRLRYADVKGAEMVIDWDHVQPGILIVGNPYPDVLDVQIVGSARFDTEVRRLIVELRLKSQPELVTTRVLTLQQPSATWSVPLQNRADRAYEYRVTIHTVRNEVQEGQWLAGADGTLIVGEGIARLRQIQMIFVGRSLKDLQLLGIKVRFAFDDSDAGLHAEDEFLVQDLAKPLPWSYPIADPARQSFTYQLSKIYADGRIQQGDPVTTQELLVVCPLM